jgi:hypothetical protein
LRLSCCFLPLLVRSSELRIKLICNQPILCTLPIGSAVKCYNCRYTEDPTAKNCNDPFVNQSIPIISCDGSCIIGKRRGDSKKNIFLIKKFPIKLLKFCCFSALIRRYCGPATTAGCITKIELGLTYDECACNTDFCNGVEKPALSGAILVGLTAFFLRFSSYRDF